MKHREIKDYFNDILKECRYLIERTNTCNYDQFLKNEDLPRAFVRSLEVIGEAVKNIPQEIREKYKEVEWREIITMRNRISHEYFGIDYEIVWQTAIEDIPVLKKQIEKIIKEIYNNG